MDRFGGYASGDYGGSSRTNERHYDQAFRRDDDRYRPREEGRGSARGYDNYQHRGGYDDYGGYDNYGGYQGGYGDYRQQGGGYDNYQRRTNEHRDYQRQGDDRRRDGDRANGGGHGNYHRRGDDRRRDGDRGGGGGRYASRGGGERRRDGRGGAREDEGPGAGFIPGCGFEHTEDEVTDLHIEELWSGRAGMRDVDTDDPELHEDMHFCRRPGVGRSGRTTRVNVNHFSVSLDSAPLEIFKYHVTVERPQSMETVARYGPASSQPNDGAAAAAVDGETGADASSAARREPRPERPLPPALVRDVINAALCQYEEDFKGVRVAHDGMSALYAPVKLPWDTKEFIGVNPDDPRAVLPAETKVRRPKTFTVKMKFVEVVKNESLVEYYQDPGVNVRPVLQAMDTIARHLATQRLVAVGSELFSMKEVKPLPGGKELCWGYHQAIHLGDRKLVMNIDQATSIFYSPGPLMNIAMAALRARGPERVRAVSEQEGRVLARGLRKVEVKPTHREDRKRPICGVSPQRADETMINVRGQEISVATYFSQRYGKALQYPVLPPVNVGGRRPGTETWLPIEVCTVVPGQHFASSDDLDLPEITRLTSQPPQTRKENILNVVRQAHFETDQVLAAFGMVVDQRLETVDARIVESPFVQFANVSVHRTDGQWSLNNKKFVKGAKLHNWGVLVLANVASSEVRKFVGTLCNVGQQRGMDIRDNDPVTVYQSDHRRESVKGLMRLALEKLEQRGKGAAQLLVVILPDTNTVEYRDVKLMSDTVLGVASQCVAATNLRKANATFCANVALKMNMRLDGKNAVLPRLPLLSTAATIIFGADVEYLRRGMDYQPAIAAVVASMDAFSAQYAARVAVQKGSNDIPKLPHMIRELLLAYYDNTKRRPKHVVYYRDGVSEGDMADVLKTEMCALRMAFKMISASFRPQVTYIVANKRHHTRAFPVNPRDGDSKGNVKPGTVVDTGVVDPHRFDFFLWGHSSLQGTSKPCHYTVLRDENKLSADEIQQLTYHLGYTFARSTHSVSVVTPVYYANEAAAHARNFLVEESGAENGGTKFEFAKVHANVMNRMFFI